MKSESNISPKILSIQWGAMNIEGVGKGRDFKLWPGGGRPWDWGETGTQHSPGIQIADIEELIEHGSRLIFLTKGFNLRLQIRGDTLDYLNRKGIEVVVQETRQGVKLYNDSVSKGKQAGGLFHSTC
jgi:hypothetical protein